MRDDFRLNDVFEECKRDNESPTHECQNRFVELVNCLTLVFP